MSDYLRHIPTREAWELIGVRHSDCVCGPGGHVVTAETYYAAYEALGRTPTVQELALTLCEAIATYDPHPSTR